MSSATAEEGRSEPAVDLLVVGSGAAGLTAAVTAAHAGLQVVVVERADTVGGTTAKSGGVYWVPGNHLQPDNGIEDGLHHALPYMARVSAPDRYDPEDELLGLTPWEYELTSTYPGLCAEAVQFLDRIGAVRSTIETALSFPDYHISLPEQGGIYGRALCARTAQGEPGNGAELIAQLLRAAEDLDVRIETGCRVVDLVTAGHSVAGLVVDRGPEQPQSIVHAKLGVVLAAGGFTHNAERRERHLPAKVWGGCASGGNAGDLLDALEDLEIPLHNLDTAWWQQVAIEHTIHGTSETRAGVWVAPGDSSLIVDPHGHRVVNEKAVYNERAKIHLGGRGAPEVLFLIYDRRTAELFSTEPFSYPLPVGDEPTDHVVQGSSLADLADGLRRRTAALADHLGHGVLDESFESNLVATIDRFNRFASAGHDDDFARGSEPIEAFFTGAHRPGGGPNPTMAPLSGEGPYFAVIVGLGALDTKGGPRTDTHARVLDADEHPVEGLYAAGNCAASPSNDGYWAAGATIGPAMAFGYAAARHAAARASVADKAGSQATDPQSIRS